MFILLYLIAINTPTITEDLLQEHSHLRLRQLRKTLCNPNLFRASLFTPFHDVLIPRTSFFMIISQTLR